MIGVLTYLNENNIIHRDIKLENFLLTDKDDISSIKLIDFGLSKDMTYNTLTKTNVGTPFYVAPEVVMN
jgi:calcium-dependent protein kinase